MLKTLTLLTFDKFFYRLSTKKPVEMHKTLTEKKVQKWWWV